MRVYLRVAKRLATEPHLPRPLRWLLVFAVLPIPGPVDELALVLAAATIAVFYRPRFRTVLAEERLRATGPGETRHPGSTVWVVPPSPEPRARASDVTAASLPVEVTWAALPPYTAWWHVRVGNAEHHWDKSPLAPVRYELEAWLARLPGVDETTAQRLAEGFPEGDWFRPG